MSSPRTVLIVEDNPLNREMLCELLAQSYRTLEAENGQEALDILGHSGGDIALILLDVMMPVMDGYTFLKHLRQHEDWSLIPVIVTTQRSSEVDEVDALAHGATDFVPKPYAPQVLLHRVASLIKLRETAAMVNQLQSDRLTGLFSKEYFYRRVHERLEENPDTEFTIVCTNIENFKLYNDVYGIKAGNELLCRIAALLRDHMGDSGICGRYSADRFLCLQEKAVEERDRARYVSEDAPRVEASMPDVVIKWGVYPIIDRTVPVEQMCDRALLAVDSIKGRYNCRVAIYDDAMRSRLLRERQITGAMETALESGQFEVFLQPKYSLRSGHMVGAEALVRWRHPEWGMVSPGDFIPLFEKNGFITKLDYFVWERVCALMSQWRSRGIATVPISVNVSRQDVYQGDLIAKLIELTGKYGISPANLHLEITESMYSDYLEHLLSTVDTLRSHGFIVEMDDFGSGYSSLNMLTEMKLDVLKLDMKFVRNETARSREESILRHIMELAHWKHLSVVAEGVENGLQVERLQEAGCDIAQGFFFARPMPADAFEQRLLEQAVESAQSQLLEQESHETTILVVEEDDHYRAAIRSSLSNAYRVMEAGSREAALMAVASCAHTRLTAVVLSMSLPDDGSQEVLKALRVNHACWQAPVLALIPRCDNPQDLSLLLGVDDFLCKCHPMTDLRRRVEHLVQYAVIRRREADLRDEALHDYATGLLNRRGLRVEGEQLRRDALPLSVFMFDLDNLKTVNDTNGHARGDKMILCFAQLLRSKTRPTDILCRYGGDEFVAVLPNLGSEEDAQKRADDICQEFRRRMEAEGIHATCSAGIALCDPRERPTSSLIDRADRAMYYAKQRCKGSSCVWSPELGREA